MQRGRPGESPGQYHEKKIDEVVEARPFLIFFTCCDLRRHDNRHPAERLDGVKEVLETWRQVLDMYGVYEYEQDA